MTNKKPTPMYVLAKELDQTACCIPKVGIAMKASILEVSALRAPAGVVAYGVGETGIALFIIFLAPFLYSASIALQTYTYTTLHCGRRGSGSRYQLMNIFAHFQGLLTTVQLPVTRWSAHIWISC